MELVIIHEKGWSCTNDAERGTYLGKSDEGLTKLIKYDTVTADKVYDVVSSHTVGVDAFFIFSDQKGWVAEITSINKKEVRARKKSELTKDKINILINQIKKHGSSR